MKKVIVVISAALLAACGGGGGNDDDTAAGVSAGDGVPSGGNTGTPDTPDSAASADAAQALPAPEFLRSEFQEGTGEILLSRLALERATTPRVRQFAQVMIDHHAQANAEIEVLAAERGVTLPGDAGSAHRARLDEMQRLSGIEFDRAYMNYNVALHDVEVAQHVAMLAASAAQGDANGTTGGTGTGGTGTGTGATGSDTGTTGTATGATGTGTGATGTGTGATGTDTGATTGTGTGATAPGTPGSAPGLGSDIDAGLTVYLVKMKAILSQHLGMAKEVNGEINPSAWLVNVYQDGLAEIQLSTLALQRAQNADVRRFAQMMIDEHTRANNEVAQVAQAKGVTLPSNLTADQRSAAEELDEVEGAVFDQAYMNHNVIVHALSVRQTRVQAAGAGDPDVQALAARTLPHLEAHLAEANRIYQALPDDLLLSAWADGLGEILLSSLAVQRATDPEVRRFAQTMINDHTQANTAVAQLAGERDRYLPIEPSAETALAFMELAPLTGSAFDRAYMESNVAVHQKDVTLFGERAQNEPDANLRAFAAQTLPVLEMHLREATGLRDRVGATGGGTTGGTPAGGGTTGDTPAGGGTTGGTPAGGGTTGGTPAGGTTTGGTPAGDATTGATPAGGAGAVTPAAVPAAS